MCYNKKRNDKSRTNLLDTKRNDGKQTENKNKEKGIRSYFFRLFGKYDFRDEKSFVSFGKWLIFIILLLVETVLALEYIAEFSTNGGWGGLMILLVTIALLTIASGLQFIVKDKSKAQFFLYALSLAFACGFMFISEGLYALIIYMLVLTEFYISADKRIPAYALFAIGAPLYAVCYALQIYFNYHGNIELISLITESVATAFTLFIHFLVVQIALAFYRQFLKLDKTLKELDKSKKELEKAYQVVAEVSALEERQRIAKDIHDTAGHSITTVIMQTESAKLIIGENPEEARQKIISANLQAKHALEELRDSVHLLSGIDAGETLKSALTKIVNESTDGTNIIIRSEIEDIQVSSAKFRFLCNTLKEGLSNAFRHGGATAFWFECKADGDKIRFLLSDNGKGVTGGKLKLGYGLKSMKDRAKALGGEIYFTSEEGDGFEIKLILPADTKREVWNKQ